MNLKTEKIWFNGSLVDWDKATVHVLTHALHYGSGAFEGIRFYETEQGIATFRLKDHLMRLERSFSWIGKTPFSVDELCKASKLVVSANKLKEGYLRPLVFIGMQKMGMDLTGMPVHVAIAAWPWGAYLGSDALSTGVKCKISIFERPSNNAYPSQAKLSGKYVNSMMAKMNAVLKGYHESIMLSHDGHVSEGPGENLFVVKDNILVSPGAESDALEGITRDSVLTIARDMNYKIENKKVTKEMLFSADEAFFTGTAAELTPISSVDNHVIGEGKRGPLTEKLQKKFFDTVHGKEKKYLHWLDFV